MKKLLSLLLPLALLLSLTACGEKSADEAARQTPPTLTVTSANACSVTLKSSSYDWTYTQGLQSMTAIACGAHPLDETSRDITPVLEMPFAVSAAYFYTVTLDFGDNSPDSVSLRCWPSDAWGSTGMPSETVLRPIEGPAWGYRFRARLSVRYVAKKGKVLVGFHERKSRYIADMETCKILPPHVDALLMPLRALVASMDARETCPQIEVACGDDVTALVLRHLEPLSDADQQRLRDFAAAHQVQWWLQAKGPDTVQLMDEGGAQLAYALPEFGITMPFKPTDFTQVNPHINRVLVARSLRLLGAQKHERVIDWFCGLGNFTLPIATMAREVLGIEGSDALVQRSHENYASNNAARPDGQALAATTFVARNLFEMTPEMLIADGQADKWLVDPPREGAFALAKALADIHKARHGVADAPALPAAADGWTPPTRIVYVSCNPATLARDAGLLVHQGGYRCVAAGAVNMFPHTAHVESMAVFEWDGHAPSVKAEEGDASISTV